MTLFGQPHLPLYHHTPHSGWEHICGLYYTVCLNTIFQRTYLPQVDLQAHATILATTSRTVLKQTFVNPSTERGIKEVRYTFPLYDGVSVVGFLCHVGDRKIVGEVKEKDKAKAVFKEAVARGETAGLLEQLPDAADVFTTTVGNVPPGAKIIVEITYLGELKHDMEVDGIRYTIPNVICPRYGSYPGNFRTTPSIEAFGGGFSVTVDAEMADGSFIQKIQSPTHPIAMTMGTTSIAPDADPVMTKASATLTLGSAQLDTDFVIQVVAKNTGVPKAVLENHPTIPNHRALMATLVPKFALPPEKPEIVFVCDRSGSMAGSRMTLVVQALKVFLKSLPVGVKFNICSFGSNHSFLWKKSVTYSQSTLDEAIRHAETFSANFGGTEMLHPLKATIDQRYKDIPLDVMLLTDGEIWDQQTLFTYLNKSVTKSKEPIRLFTLGIGNGVSHSLIEGVAKAGDGFSQTVGEGEKMDTKVVRMLKGALSPHINNYTLAIKYDVSSSEGEDDFEIVEKVADSLKIKLDLNGKKEEKKRPVGFQSKMMRAFFADFNQKKTISLFDTSVDPDKEEPPAYDETGEERYAHLPKVPVPKIIQAPQNIPSLFAFNRTTAYLILGPEAPQATPKSVVLRGTSTHGPLELEIPIQILDSPGETIHQLAAKKAITELEQGRGWLPEAKTEAGTLIKKKFEGRFDDMVEREAVRLGVQFQVGGKWCSFVAVESNQKSVEAREKDAQGWEWLEDESLGETPASSKYTFDGSATPFTQQQQSQQQWQQNSPHMNSRSALRSRKLQFSQDTTQVMQRNIRKVAERGERLDSLIERSTNLSTQSASFKGGAKKSASSGLYGGLFGSAKPPPPGAPALTFSGRRQSSDRGGMNSSVHSMSYAPLTPAASSGISASRAVPQAPGAPPSVPSFGQSVGSSAPPPSAPNHALQDYQMQFMLLEQQNKKRLMMARQEQDGTPAPAFGAPAASASPSLFGSAAPPPPPAPMFQAHSAFGVPDADHSEESFRRGASDSAALESFDFDSFLHADESAMDIDSVSAPAVEQKKAKSGSPSGGDSRRGNASDGADGGRFGGYSASASKSSPPAPSIQAPEDLVLHLISLQTFEGSWEYSSTLFALLEIDEAIAMRDIAAGPNGPNGKHLATAVVIAVFEQRLGALKGSWELVVDKAREWLEGERGDAEEVIKRAKKVVK